MKAHYYIEINGNPKGPFTIEELKELTITKESVLWKEGLPDWVKATEIEEINKLIKIPVGPNKIIPPPLPVNSNEIKQTQHINRIEIIKNILRLKRKQVFGIILLTIASYASIAFAEGGFKAMQLYFKYNEYVNSQKGIKELEQLRKNASSNSAIQSSKNDTLAFGNAPLDIAIAKSYRDQTPIPAPYKDMTEYYHYLNNPDPSDPFLDFKMMDALQENMSHSFGLTTILEALGVFVLGMLILILNNRLWKS
jgi:hypothetical protein